MAAVDDSKSKAESAAERKAWLSEPSRDYEYVEVRHLLVFEFVTDSIIAAPWPVLRHVTCLPSVTRRRWSQTLHFGPTEHAPRRQQTIGVCQCGRHLPKDAQVITHMPTSRHLSIYGSAGNPNMSFSSYSPNWGPPGPSMAAVDWSCACIFCVSLVPHHS